MNDKRVQISMNDCATKGREKGKEKWLKQKQSRKRRRKKGNERDWQRRRMLRDSGKS